MTGVNIKTPHKKGKKIYLDNTTNFILNSILFFIIFVVFVFILTLKTDFIYNRIDKLEKIYKSSKADVIKVFMHRYSINDYFEHLIDRNKIDQIYEIYDQYTNDRKLTTLIINTAILNRIPVNLLFGLIWIESNFQSNIINEDNNNNYYDYGLMQLNAKTFSNYSKEYLLDPKNNIKLGTDYLLSLYKQYNSWQEAILRYNYGTRNYVPSISIKYFVLIVNKEEILDELVTSVNIK